MAKKLISFDDAASSGTGLPDAVEAVLHATYVRPTALAGFAQADETLPVEVAESPGGYIRGTRDTEGRIAEDAIDAQGQVPQWVLDRWKSRMGSGGTAGGRIHIVVCGGQSNAAVSGGVTPPAGLYDTDLRLWKWHRATSSIIPMSSSEAYLLPSFAREYIKTVPSDVSVLIVPAGAGETGFTTTSLSTPPAGYRTVPNGTWDRTLTSDPSNLYDRMVTDTQDARTAATEISTGAPKVVALLWSQGESDVGFLNQSEYSAKVDDLIGQFRTDVALPGLPVLVGSMTPEYVARTPSAADVHKALVDTPRRVERTAFVWGPEGLPRTDQSNYIHWSVAGQAERGRLFTESLPRAHWNYDGVYAVPPQSLQAVRSGTTLYATWDPSVHRATSHVVEFSTDAGVTWSPITITDGVLGLSGTATVPETGALLVRASATNETNTSSYVTVEV